MSDPTPILHQILLDSPSLSLYLRAVQARFNWVSKLSMELGAEHFNVSYMKVYEQAAFSPSLCLDERGLAVIEVCQGLACREAGSDDVLRALEAASGLRPGQTSDDGALTLCRQSCFGRCAIGPNVRLKGIYYSNQAPDQAASLLKTALS